MKISNLIVGAVLGLASTLSNATTVFEPTDGDINFSLTTNVLASYTLAIFDDEADLLAGSADRIEVSVPELIFWDSANSELHNADSSQTLAIADGNFVLGVSNGDGWIGGDVNAPNLLATLLMVPEVNQYTVTFGNVEGFQLVVDVAPVPVPAAVWLFGTGLIGMVGVARRKA